MRKPITTPSHSSGVTSAATDPAYTRLHITPLDPNLLTVLVPSTVLPSIRDLSYHHLQTFPDKPYGFLELPSADADKIKRKLNGAVLRGSKIRIESARPVKMLTQTEDAIMRDVDAIQVREDSKKARKEKSRKHDALELPGIELEKGRKVKRGWTVTSNEANSKKRKDKNAGKSKGKKNDKDNDREDSSKKEKRRKKEPESLYTEGAECLVKTLLPPNKRALADNEGGKRKKATKRGRQEGVLVHEFERNMKFATFLKTTNDSGLEQAATTFVEGLGWVDENGALIENVKTTRPIAFPKMQVERPDTGPKPAVEDVTTSSSDDTSSDDESDTEVELSPTKRPRLTLGNSSPVEDKKGISSDATRPKSSSSIRSLTINIPPVTSSGKVHPLEALYKQQRKDDAVTKQEAATAELFAFGDLGDDVEDDDNTNPQDVEGGFSGEGESPHRKQGVQPPMTPFTKQDLEWRNVRSAAPTPDTAHPSRLSRLWFPTEGEGALDDLEEGDEEDDVGREGTPSGHRHGSDQHLEDDSNSAPADFQKIFWERRAELNRSWKKRRRMSAKEKRYRENKARADRAI